jgi:hypothetical protein
MKLKENGRLQMCEDLVTKKQQKIIGYTDT